MFGEGGRGNQRLRRFSVGAVDAIIEGLDVCNGDVTVIRTCFYIDIESANLEEMLSIEIF